MLKGNLAGAKVLYVEEGEKIATQDKIKVKIPGIGSWLTIGEVTRVRKSSDDLFWDIDVTLITKNTFFDRVFIIK